MVHAAHLSVVSGPTSSQFGYFVDTKGLANKGNFDSIIINFENDLPTENISQELAIVSQ